LPRVYAEQECKYFIFVVTAVFRQMKSYGKKRPE